MKKPIAIAIFVAFFLHSVRLPTDTGEATAATIVVDQSNTVADEISRGLLSVGEGLAQSFTPTLAGLDIFTASMASRGASTVQVRLFSGETTAGAPIASSSIIQLRTTDS